MRRSMLIPAFLGLLFVIMAAACGSSAPAAPAATAIPVAAATAAPVTTEPPTSAPPTEAPATAAPATEAPATAAPAQPAPAATAEGEPQHAPADVSISAASPEQAGEYLVWLGGCNDCHTVGWDASKASMPTSDWLTGGRRFSGAYGVSYAANLRLTPQNYTEDEFVKMIRTREVNPPMPWAHYHDLNEKDLRAVYSFLKSLGPKGEPPPAFVPAPKESPTPAPTDASPTSTPVVTPAPTATLVPENLRPAPPADAFIQAASPELAGEYFIWVGHCNACHTNSWTPTTPKSDWLTGGRKFNIAGGVAYAGNLRLLPQTKTEAEFIQMMRTREEHLPMGWFNFHQLNEKDLSALYRFFVSLGPKGDPAPPFEPAK